MDVKVTFVADESTHAETIKQFHEVYKKVLVHVYEDIMKEQS